MRKQKEWNELTTSGKISIVISGLIQVALLLAALRDLRQRPKEQINGSKWMWSVIVLINFIGPIAYFAFGRKRRE